MKIPTMTDEEWGELKAATLKQWLAENHPAALQEWEERFSDLVDLDMWVEEYRGAIDREFENALEGE